MRLPSHAPVRCLLWHFDAISTSTNVYVHLHADCKIRYYHNYYVHDDFRHFYSSDIPAVVQIENHAFVESELCELYTSFMLFAWVSQHNCANIHNASIKRSAQRQDLSTELSISSEQVSRAFVMNALLRDCAENGTALILPNDGDHDERLKNAMERRNQQMILRGQIERMHACNRGDFLSF